MGGDRSFLDTAILMLPVTIFFSHDFLMGETYQGNNKRYRWHVLNKFFTYRKLHIDYAVGFFSP